MTADSQRLDDEGARAAAQRTREALTLAEKVALISNAQMPSDTLGPIRLADGAAGIRRAAEVTNAPASTALPAPIALAATWDPALAERYGAVLGRELRATGHHVLLGPAVDIARVPLTGRIYESLGEDPQLAADLVVPEIAGIQEQGAQACIKHFALNNQEASRATIDVRVDERTLRELYLPAFEAAVVDGGSASVMSSYNRVDGTYASHSSDLLTRILRDEWGFEGWVASDFLANHALADSFEAGLDWELTDAPFWGAHLLAAVQSGQIAEDQVDLRVERILRAYFALAQQVSAPALSDDELTRHNAFARRVATEGSVLLSNNGVLPLSADTARIAVIGPDAAAVTAAGAGSPLVEADTTRSVSVLAGLRSAFPAATVTWRPGADPIGPAVLLPGPDAIPSGLLHTPDGAPGVEVSVWPFEAGNEDPIWSGTVPTIEINEGFFASAGFRAPSPGWSALPDTLPVRYRTRWRGTFHAPTAGIHRLGITHLGSARLDIDGTPVITAPHRSSVDAAVPEGILWDGEGARVDEVELVLPAGPVPFELHYATDVPAQSEHYGAQLRLGWEPPAGTTLPAHVDAASSAAVADVAVVVVRAYETEAMDRPSTRLPQGQESLIRAVAATGTPTVVVTMSGGPVDTSTWRDDVAAHLHAWYPGQQQGSAIADLLRGDAEPRGRLPLTFPRGRVERGSYLPAAYPGENGRVTYSEGQAVGYRDAHRDVAYPFGFGLGYADIQIGTARLAVDGRSVLVDVENRSDRPGSELVQVYLADPDTGRADRLIAWHRIDLEPGASATADIRLSTAGRRWQHWDGGWQPINGRQTLLVGSSAAHIAAQIPIQMDDIRATEET